MSKINDLYNHMVSITHNEEITWSERSSIPLWLAAELNEHLHPVRIHACSDRPIPRKRVEIHVSASDNLLAVLEGVPATGGRCRWLPHERQHEEFQGTWNPVAGNDWQLSEGHPSHSLTYFYLLIFFPTSTHTSPSQPSHLTKFFIYYYMYSG